MNIDLIRNHDECISYFEKMWDLLNYSSNDHIILWDLKSGVFRIAPSFLENFDLPSACITSPLQYWLKIIYPTDISYFMEEHQKFMEGKTQTYLKEYRLVDKSGENVWVRVKGQGVFNEENLPTMLIGRVTELKNNEVTNPITGLLTKETLENDYNNKSQDIAKDILLFLGIDNFKNVNDKYGYGYGNEILAILSKELEKQAKDIGRVYYLHDDLFAIDLRNCTIEEANELYKTICEQFAMDCRWLERPVYCTISGGAVNVAKQSFEDIYNHGMTALNSAKKKGKNQLVIYSRDISSPGLLDSNVEAALRHCVDNDFQGFNVVYQPQLNLQEGVVTGAEALLRWSYPENNQPVSPRTFIPILESSGLINQVGLWVFEQAVIQCCKWQKFDPNFVVSINVSYVQMLQPSCSQQFLDCINKHGLDPKTVILEFTESVRIMEIPDLNTYLSPLIQAGIRIAIDDFGTGYSSLSYLKSLDLSEIKIDRCFITNVQENDYNFELIKNIIGLSHKAGMTVCIEGVETEEELQVLEALKPDYVQGYLYGKPLPASTFEKEFFSNFLG